MTKPGRTYAQIDTDYFNDARVLAAGDAWQLHFAAILLAKRLLTDGRLTLLQLKQAAPMSVSDLDGQIGRLADVGLFTIEGDEVVIRSWDDWNMPASEVTDKRRRASQLANHDRWRHQEKPSPTCIVCQEKGLVPTPDQIGPPIGPPNDPKRTPTTSLGRDRGESESETKTNQNPCANSSDSDSRLAAGLTADSRVNNPLKEMEQLVGQSHTVDIFEAVIEECRISLEYPPNQDLAKEVVDAVLSLREADATVEDIENCADRFRTMHVKSPRPSELSEFFQSVLS